MDNKLRLFSSESVTEGHPDKVCDLIADTILDKALEQDPFSRIACEVCCTTGLVMVLGEFTTEGYIDIPAVVRQTVADIGYTNAEFGFDSKTCAVVTSINEQSADISVGVTEALEKRRASNDPADAVGAGDQGMMFGYATNETEEFMPLPITLAHKLTKALGEARKSGLLPYLRPDGKAQVTVAYDGNKPVYVDTVVLSTQHSPDIEHADLEDDIIEKIIKPTLGGKYLNDKTKYYINPTGRFVIGGPAGDSGVTGRKIIVDTYGGMCPHGGGAFSGKDPTKVDRSACYYARYVCKNMVAAGAAERMELQVAYAIGKARPVSISINTFGTSPYSDDELLDIINDMFDFRPLSIIENLDLRKPIYRFTTIGGHFGKSDMTWERTDKADKIRARLKELSK
ncbi:MAG: methionine adenosyltransferase [Clostridia bacterium]|uniref:methionine adenosyltransferase n=1 Tax=Pumilibacter muris TaxID=2941510 RepID=UPI00203AB6A7|nr:methionine adenosyltransferase [Pumilibacter muris]MCI8596688.1 methionine adenosyltransferase [Clostridia bacterium]